MCISTVCTHLHCKVSFITSLLRLEAPLGVCECVTCVCVCVYVCVCVCAGGWGRSSSGCECACVWGDAQGAHGR